MRKSLYKKRLYSDCINNFATKIAPKNTTLYHRIAKNMHTRVFCASKVPLCFLLPKPLWRYAIASPLQAHGTVKIKSQPLPTARQANILQQTLHLRSSPKSSCRRASTQRFKIVLKHSRTLNFATLAKYFEKSSFYKT